MTRKNWVGRISEIKILEKYNEYLLVLEDIGVPIKVEGGLVFKTGDIVSLWAIKGKDYWEIKEYEIWQN